MDIYNNLPVILQNAACYYEGYKIEKSRYSKHFWNYLRDYESRNDWTYDQLIQYRDFKLQKMIAHCYKTVPYYTKLFNEIGLDYKSIKTIDDLKVLPILNKEDIKKDSNSFISSAVPKSELKIHHTGGTTGSGLEFYTTDEEEAEQWAVWWRYRKNLGINFDMWCGNFGGKIIVPLKNKQSPFWRYNYPGKQIFFSGYHINDQTAKYYVEEIKKRNLKWLHGYPSNLANLASYMIENGIYLNIKYVTIGSEGLYEHQYDMIYKAFNTKPFQHYGLAEGVANFSQKLDGKIYVDEDFSAVEFVPNLDSTYSIIGTSLSNWAMPLLRYDTGDQAYISRSKSEGEIGGRVIKKILGRTNEYVILNNNSRISSAALSLVFKDISSIRESQIIQKEKTSILVRIAIMDDYSFKDEDKITKGLKERLGTDMKVLYEYVNEIPRTQNGKIRLVISELE